MSDGGGSNILSTFLESPQFIVFLFIAMFLNGGVPWFDGDFLMTAVTLPMTAPTLSMTDIKDPALHCMSLRPKGGMKKWSMLNRVMTFMLSNWQQFSLIV